MSASHISAQSIEQIPPALLQTLPAGAAPPGILPNFVDPPTLVPAVLGVGTAFLALALFCFSIRVWTKLAINKRCSWDDLRSLPPLPGSIIASDSKKTLPMRLGGWHTYISGGKPDLEHTHPSN
ncbi:MAG: hypothetical protein Q9221_002091 [Calogaya cf. arnoldii]